MACVGSREPQVLGMRLYRSSITIDGANIRKNFRFHTLSLMTNQRSSSCKCQHSRAEIMSRRRTK